MFPGQGSQQVGMGENLFKEFRDLVASANQILQYSVQDLCVNDCNNKLDETEFAQLAIYVVNALSYFKWCQENQEKRPSYLLGHSLGELNALLAAEVFDFITGLEIVKKRAQLMQRMCGGKMAAIVGLSIDKVAEIIYENQLDQLYIANYNSLRQVVISGNADSIEKTQFIVEALGGKFYLLKTKGAFHSPFMSPIRQEFAEFLKKFKFKSPKVPVIANISAREYTIDCIIPYLSWHLVSPVRWYGSIEYILQLNNCEFLELGIGNILTKLVANIKQEIHLG